MTRCMECGGAGSFEHRDIIAGGKASVGAAWDHAKVRHGRITVDNVGEMPLLRVEDYAAWRCPDEPGCGCGSDTMQIAPQCVDAGANGGAVIAVLVRKQRLVMLQCAGCGGMVGAFKLADIVN